MKSRKRYKEGIIGSRAVYLNFTFKLFRSSSLTSWRNETPSHRDFFSEATTLMFLWWNFSNAGLLKRLEVIIFIVKMKSENSFLIRSTLKEFYFLRITFWAHPQPWAPWNFFTHQKIRKNIIQIHQIPISWKRAIADFVWWSGMKDEEMFFKQSHTNLPAVSLFILINISVWFLSPCPFH